MGLKEFFNRKRKRLALRMAASSANSNPSPTNSRSSSTRSRSSLEGELKQVFQRFDVNGDGLISSAELGSIMSSLGHQIDENGLQIMIKDADSDGDGYINFQEFVEINTKDVDSKDAVEDLKEAFSMIDIDSDGYISAEELQRVIMESLGEESSLDECKRMISGVDSNGDGTINFEKFVAMMMGSRLSSANEPQI